MAKRVAAKKRTSSQTKKKAPPFQVYPPPVLALPPDVEFVLDILREGFKEHRDQKSLKGLETLIKRIHELSLETQLSSRCVERNIEKDRARRINEQQKLQQDQGAIFEGLYDPARMAERAVQAMLWTDLQRALEPTPGVPDSERFVVLDEQGKRKRLFPKGSDAIRRFAKKAYTLRQKLQAHFEACSWQERTQVLFTLFQTPPPPTLVLDLRGKKKPRKMPKTLMGRKAEYRKVQDTIHDLREQITALNNKDPLYLEALNNKFPELDGIHHEQLPSFRSIASLARIVLSKRWEVTPSTVQTRLKRLKR